MFRKGSHAFTEKTLQIALPAGKSNWRSAAILCRLLSFILMATNVCPLSQMLDPAPTIQRFVSVEKIEAEFQEIHVLGQRIL